MTSLLFLLRASAVLQGSGCADDESPPQAVRRSAPLTQGVLDPDDAAVVGIMFGSHAACTGVLVAPQVVLTAAHCLVAYVTPPRVLFGADAAAPTAVIDVAAIYVYADFSPLSPAHDLAALRLERPAPPGILPVALPPAASVGIVAGTGVRLVGFGHDSNVPAANAAHVKRQGTATVAAVATETITLAPAPSQACLGDSGAPVLWQLDGNEVLIGMVLGGTTSCLDAATALRTDAFSASFIDPVINGLIPSPDSPQPGAPNHGCNLASDRPEQRSVILFALAGLILLAGRRSAKGVPSSSRDGTRTERLRG